MVRGMRLAIIAIAVLSAALLVWSLGGDHCSVGMDSGMQGLLDKAAIVLGEKTRPGFVEMLLADVIIADEFKVERGSWRGTLIEGHNLPRIESSLDFDSITNIGGAGKRAIPIMLCGERHSSPLRLMGCTGWDVGDPQISRELSLINEMRGRLRAFAECFAQRSPVVTREFEIVRSAIDISRMDGAAASRAFESLRSSEGLSIDRGLVWEVLNASASDQEMFLYFVPPIATRGGGVIAELGGMQTMAVHIALERMGWGPSIGQPAYEPREPRRVATCGIIALYWWLKCRGVSVCGLE